MSYQRVVIKEFGPPDVLEIIQEKMLPEPGPGEVRVKVLAAGASFTDTMIRKGVYPGVKQKPPFSPGYEMIGEVDKLGEDATKFSLGQRVAELTVTGAYTEYLCLPESNLVSVPSDVDPAEAVSLVLSYVTAYQMLHRTARVQPGQRILVHGAGGAVGTALLQLGRLLDLDLYGTASQPKHDLISSLDAMPIDYRTEDFQKRILQLTASGVDAVFDPIGGDHFRRSFSTLNPGGTLVVYGFYNAAMGRGSSAALDFLRTQLWHILPNRRSVRFYSIAPLRKRRPDWFSEDLGQLLSLLVDGKIKPVIGARIPLLEVRQAHQLIEQAEVQGKIVLEVG